jgi:uncharacterized repeat protein (TIGR01451 family)
MKKLITYAFGTVLAVTASAPVLAASPIELTSNIFVEKQQKKADGTYSVNLVKPDIIVPGDQLVFVVRFRNIGSEPASNFTVTNPMPKAVAFSGTSDGAELVSIDGGKSWGKLSQLRVGNADGTSRPALMTDVTHIKWNLNQTLTAGAEGKLIFRGVVR